MRAAAQSSGKWLSLAVVILMGALSLVVLEVEYRQSTTTLHRTVTGIDNLTRAQLLVMQAYVKLQQVDSADPTADELGPTADLEQAIDLIRDLRQGRSSLLGVRARSRIATPALEGAAEAYATSIADLVTRYRSRDVASPIERRVAFASVERRADELERQMYDTLRERLATEADRHTLLLIGWSGFLLLSGLILTTASRERSKADAARVKAEASRELSESRYQALIENSGEIVSILGVDGTIKYESPAVERVLGYTPAEREGQNAFSYVHPADLAAAKGSFHDAAGSTAAASAEFRTRHEDGSWRILSVAARSMLGHPAVDGVVVNSRDVTQLRESEVRLLQAQKMEAIGRLAGGIAHDFNNVLMAIKGSVSFLGEDLGVEHPSHSDVEDISTAVERAARLTRQLLAFSRQQVLQPQVVDLAALVGEQERMLRRLVPEDIEIRTAIEPDLWRIKADPGQMEQVLMNLVVNANDAMPDGGTVSITLANCLVRPGSPETWAGIEPGSYVRLNVTDTGEGIPEEVAEHIFEPFFTTKLDGRGTGLGLSTVYGIVQQSGGHIVVEGNAGTGAAFDVYLPRTDALHLPRSADAPAAPEISTGTILLVEDEPEVRRSLARLLRRHGLVVCEAESGAEALEILRAHDDIELIISDIVMPKMSGVDLASRVHSTRPDLPCLLMSGYLDDEVARRGLGESGAHFIQKPFEYGELLRKIAALISRS